MASKKIIGFLCWAISLIPLQYALLNTETVVYESGLPNNTKGVISFVVFITLLFVGYALVDSASDRSADAHGH